MLRFQFDQRVIARIDFCRLLWIQGLADQAMRMAESTIEEARALDNAISMNYALAHAACPLAFYTGALAAAERFIGLLRREAARDPTRPWELWARCWQAVLLSRQGDASVGAAMLAATLDAIPMNSFHMRYTSFVRQLADIWSQAGQHDRARATIDRALEIAVHHDEGWARAELLRVKGEIILRAGAPDCAAIAEDHFRQSLERSRRQEALSWELRAATSLARLHASTSSANASRADLASVCSRFVEGFESADLRLARALLSGRQEHP
jgi:tetratricopeptide (TPR) repeat protein